MSFENSYKLLKNATLLYAEDEAQVNKSYSYIFSSVFGRVITAYDGLEAVELYKKHEPDFVFLDYIMPRMNGLEAAEAIRGFGSDAMIVFTTARNEPSDIEHYRELGVQNVLIKPIIQEDLDILFADCENYIKS